MRYKYTSIDRIFTKLIRDYGSDEINEMDVIEWIGEALEFTTVVKESEAAVAFVEVKNHQVDIPQYLNSIISIARDTQWAPGTEEGNLCPAEVVLDTTPNDPEPAIPVALDCMGQPINAYELAYYRPYFDLQMEYYGWSNCRLYGQRFIPVKLTDSAFFNSLVCRVEGENYASDFGVGPNEYRPMPAEKKIRFSFKEGYVAIAYNRTILDPQTGYPMIPDHISHTTAITKYIIMKISERHFYNHRDGATAVMNKATDDWNWYCKQAGNVDKMPFGTDQHENLKNQMNYILPRQNLYNTFFGNLSAPEQRIWNDPNGRNRRPIYIGN